MPRKTGPDPRLLTELELEIMQTLWTHGEGTVRDAQAQLSERELAYTTVSTVLRILEQKGVVSSRKDGRAHIYTPLLSRAEHEALAVRHLVERVFDGEPQGLVAHLIDVDDLGADELARLRTLIDERLKEIP